LNINIGTWLLASPTTSYVQVKNINGVDYSDLLISSNDVIGNNVFYKRNGNTVNIGWETGTTNVFDFKIVQTT